MRHLGARLICACLLVAANPAVAVLIDDFSVGSFNLQASGPSVPEMGFDGQACLSFCLGGNRAIQMLSNSSGSISTAQLLAPPGEVQVVMPAGGGTINFIYQLFGGAVKNITEGGTASQIEVWFTAFEPGASVGIHLEDDTAGPPYFSLPVIGIQLATVPSLAPIVDVMLVPEEVAEGLTGGQVGASIHADPDDRAIFLATSVGSPTLKMAMAANFVPTALPGLAWPWASVPLGLALIAAGATLIRSGTRAMTG